MLAGVYATPEWTSELARMVRAAGADALADRLKQAIGSDAALAVALTTDEEAARRQLLSPSTDHVPEFTSCM